MFDFPSMFPREEDKKGTNKNDMSTVLLPAAVDAQDKKKVTVLLALGADPNTTNIFGVSTMTTAMIKPESESKREILIALLSYGGRITPKVISDANFWKEKSGGRVKKILPGVTRKIRLTGKTTPSSTNA